MNLALKSFDLVFLPRLVVHVAVADVVAAADEQQVVAEVHVPVAFAVDASMSVGLALLLDFQMNRTHHYCSRTSKYRNDFLLLLFTYKNMFLV